MFSLTKTVENVNICYFNELVKIDKLEKISFFFIQINIHIPNISIYSTISCVMFHATNVKYKDKNLIYLLIAQFWCWSLLIVLTGLEEGSLWV